MANIIFTEYFNVDISDVSKLDIQKAIEGQYSKWHKNYSKVDDKKYKIGFYGILLSYNIEESDNGYKVIGQSEYTIQIWILMIISLAFALIGIVFLLIGLFSVTKQFENSVKKAKEAFSSIQKSSRPVEINQLGELEKLHELKEKGILSEDEFSEQKKKILNK